MLQHQQASKGSLSLKGEVNTVQLPLLPKRQELTLVCESLCIQSKTRIILNVALPTAEKKHPPDSDIQLRCYQTFHSFTGKGKLTIPSLGC